MTDTRRSRPIPILSAVAVSLVALVALAAMGCGGKDTGGNRSPVFTTGVGASVVEPGGGLPSMPPPGVQPGGPYGQPDPYGNGRYGASGSGSVSGYDPGNYTQSSRGGGQTASPSSNASQGSARIMSPGANPGAPPPGYPGADPYPTPQSGGGGGGMVSIGGATTIDTRRETHKMRPTDAIKSNPLLWPLAVVAWPVSKIAESTSGSAQQSQSGGPNAPVPEPLRPEELDQINDREQTLAMERALESQQRHAPPPRYNAPAPVPAPRSAPPPRYDPVGRGGVRAPSIADELAALRAAGPRYGAPTQSRPSLPPTDSYGGVGQRASAPSEPQRRRYDDDGDGRPDREEVIDANGLIAESAEDTNFDGALDTWTRYRDGAPVRRRADVDGDGMVDSWTYFEEGGLDVARLERDTDGDGYRDQIDFFAGGQLARRTEDPNGDGLPDRITRFDEEGQPAERDEDSDGDGAMDTRSFYESGRLVRRHLLNEDERWEP